MYLELLRRITQSLRLLSVLALVTFCAAASASEYHGQVIFAGLPVPGATVTATQGNNKVSVITDQQGIYFFPNLQDGAWTIDIEMQCFSPIKQTVTIASNTPAVQFELKLLSLDQIMAQAKLVKVEPRPVLTAAAPAATPGKPNAPKPADTAAPEAPKPSDETSEKANDGFLVNGSVNNAATSQFSLAPAFGNQRKNGKGLYNGGLALILDNSALDARPYSLSGLDSPRSSYNRITGVFTLGGPLNIKRLMPKGPNFFVAYQWTRDRDATTLSGLVPTVPERSGDLSGILNALGQPVQIFNPTTGLPYSGNIPISPQAQALLALYPLPNVAGNARYNYQVPVLSSIHQDSLQSRLDKTIGRRNQLYGGFAFQNTRTSGANLFGFNDKSAALGMNTNINWVHRFSHGFILNTGYRFSRIRTQETPYFANRQNISGAAGIIAYSDATPTGNDQSPTEWGPPSLAFSSGIAGLSDVNSSFNRNRTDAFSASTTWNHGRHFVTFGGDFRRQQFNYLAQQNPRGSFAFTGAATQGSVTGTGSDFADFLIGKPDTTSIAFGNADKYLRQSVYDVFITDDWRIRPDLTLNVGARWEYGAPITELHNRLVNLDVAPGFTKATQVRADSPTGTTTGSQYPNSLIRPDKTGIEPRLGLSWRPIPGSTVVVRAGYGIYRDTSIYQSVALSLAQQSPFSKSLSVANSASCPLSLIAFPDCAGILPNTFAVDPDFRAGYAQNWQLSVQRDLPFALQLTATYLGIKGTHGVQEYLPNSYALGATNPCPACPSGFIYRSSNGNSNRQAGQLQLRRRLRSGFTSTLQYVYSKSIDDDSSLGGQGPVVPGATQTTSASSSVIAQNWRDLKAERGLSSFDQRHLLTAQLQYTSGMGIGGSTLLTGWRGKLLKEWTAVAQINAGTGLPETPIYFATLPGTGVSGILRPNFTGAPLYDPPAGLFLNPAAFVAPSPGQFGNARKNSITGPGQFGLNASLARTFRLKDRYNLDLRVDSTNLLNHVVFTTWNTTINSSQFGLPIAANAMRSLQTTLRLRF